MLSVDDRRPAPPCPSPFNLAAYVLDGEGAPDDRVALVILSAGGAKRWSYGRLRSAVRQAATGFLENGLEPGDSLLMHLGQTPNFPVAFLGAIWAGILPVPVSHTLTTAELDRIVARAEPAAILTTDPQAFPDWEGPLLPPLILTTSEDTSIAAALGSPDRPCYKLLTSGTSETPRLVTHAHRAVWARRLMRDGWTALSSSDRILHAGAFNWSYTLGTGLMDPWSVGATALVLEPGTDLAMLPLLARRHDATIIAAVPGIYRRLLGSSLPPLPRLRHGLSAGEKLSESIRERWRKATGTELHEAFGQTECSTFVSGSPERPAPEGALGYVQEGRAVAILGDAGPLSRGELGEIAVSPDDPGLALGLASDGDWVRTGDLGRMAEDGAISYHGRADDVLTAGGFRISPHEIEAAFEGIPALSEVAAVDHALDSDRVVVALHYVSETAVPDAELEAVAARVLAPYKRPRLFIRHENLPRSANGKLLRRELLAERDAQ